MKSSGNYSKQIDFNSLSFEDFDQSEEKGVRKLANAGDFKAAGEAITSYIAANHDNLTPAQRCLLWFHAGQNAAHANKYEDALVFFQKASETVPDKKNQGKQQYALNKYFGPATEFYLKATIAFVNNQISPDRANSKALHEALNEVTKISILDYPPNNLVCLPGRIKDMCQAPPGTTYHDIFEMNPSLPPLPGETNWHTLPKRDPREGELVEEYKDTLKSIVKGVSIDESEMARSSFGQKRKG